MGLTDQDQEQIFRFSDKTPLLFNYWYLGFPKDDSEHEIKLLCFFFFASSVLRLIIFSIFEINSI